MARFTQAVWADRMMRATPEVRRTMAQELGRGAHEVTDEAGQPLSLHLEPMVCATARPVELKRDNSGRVIVHPVEPSKPEVLSNGGMPRLSDNDKRGFDAFLKSFEQLPPAERAAATQKLVETYIPRLIHD